MLSLQGTDREQVTPLVDRIPLPPVPQGGSAEEREQEPSSTLPESQKLPEEPPQKIIEIEEKDKKSNEPKETISIVEPVPPTVPLREPKEFIVDIYSFSDWQPSSLVIYAGDTITFVNQDDKLHWPGADPHPTHSSLPKFDALGGISKGQSYSHTFRESGVYGHHEHLLDDPPTIGTITVLPR